MPSRSSSANGSGRRRRIRKLRLAVLLGVVAFLGFSSFTFGLVSAVASEIPNCDPERRPIENGYIYARDGEHILAVLRGSESRVPAKYGDIADVMKLAIVAVEDRRFHEHRGVDLRGIARALWADIRHQRVIEGGSTITQQFVKNSCLKHERSIGRKVREAALAWQVEQAWSKPRILTAYLNTIYFGNGAYGIDQAARVYFDKRPKRLELAEAALLAGIPADPSSYDPVANPDTARARRKHVLGAMLELGWITRRDYARAAAAPVPGREDVRLPGIQGPAPYFASYVKEQLVAEYGARRVFGGGLRVRTTIDLGVQQIARDAISKWLIETTGPSAALVAIDPTNGNVLAMIGGNNFRESQFNLAVQGRRQPGSTFKPFVLAAALEEGIAPPTTFVSQPLELPLGDRIWEVENYEDAYRGAIDLETATVHSDNAVYAQLTALVGPTNVRKTAKRLGIASPLKSYFSIGLGGQGVNPLEMARAFSAFATGGIRLDTRLGNKPRSFVEIRDAERNLVLKNRAETKRVLEPETAAIVNDFLQKVIRDGTGRAAYLPDWPMAGKTGTTDEFGDAWFVGYTPRLVAAVWVGYPDRLQPMLTEFHGEPVAGGTYPALIWKSFMERALPFLRKPPVPFPPPPYLSASPRAVVQRDGHVRLDNGLCTNTVNVFYFDGFGPQKVANCLPNEVEVPRVVGLTLDAAKERLEAQPLTPLVVYRPARPRQRLDVVVGQIPAGGRRSSYDEVTLVLARPLHGVVPDVEGLPLRQARARLRKLRLRPRVVRFTDGRAGTVVSQAPPPRVAAAPGLTVRLAVARG